MPSRSAFEGASEGLLRHACYPMGPRVRVACPHLPPKTTTFAVFLSRTEQKSRNWRALLGSSVNQKNEMFCCVLVLCCMVFICCMVAVVVSRRGLINVYDNCLATRAAGTYDTRGEYVAYDRPEPVVAAARAQLVTTAPPSGAAQHGGGDATTITQSMGCALLYTRLAWRTFESRPLSSVPLPHAALQLDQDQVDSAA